MHACILQYTYVRYIDTKCISWLAPDGSLYYQLDACFVSAVRICILVLGCTTADVKPCQLLAICKDVKLAIVQYDDIIDVDGP